jgi:hypothetical protein
MSKNIAEKLIPISLNGRIIARKIKCKLINLPKEYKLEEVEKNWLIAWHGTNYTVLESIAEIGLKPAGGKSKNGEEIQVCVSHIGRMKTIDKVKDWANAIFVSPSIFYAAYGAYSKEISLNNELYKVLVEVRVKPNSFNEHNSTCPKYNPKKNEPEIVEYRISSKNETDVQVISLSFIKNEFFEKVINYEEGKFLSINNFNEKKIDEIITSNPEKIRKDQLVILKSICKIRTMLYKGSGFLIKLLKDNSPVYYLMTTEHLIGDKAIESKEEICIGLDKETIITLNKEERFIQSFPLLDITIIEILKERDDIPESYFLQPY